MKIIQALQDSNILLKGVTKTIKNETKEQKGGFLSMLLGTLGTSLLGNLLTGKGILRAGSGRPSSSASQIRKEPHPLTNFEIQKYYKNGPRFNGVFSRNNLPEYNSIKKIKDGAYITNLDEFPNVCTHSIALFCKTNEIIYFDSFGVEHIPEEIKEFIEEFPGNKNIKANIFRLQGNNSIICGYFCIGFTDFMLAGKKLTDYRICFLHMILRKMIV